jgi:hypothetical protein
MKKTDSYQDLSTAQKLEKCFYQSSQRDNFCYVTFRNRVKSEVEISGPWGGDDIMYWFEDASMLLERRIVKEFQLFRP